MFKVSISFKNVDYNIDEISLFIDNFGEKIIHTY